MATEIRFIADCMLGKLSRWLRICGFDTLYYRQIHDPDLLVRTEKEDRILLTRDHALYKLSQDRHMKAILVADDFYEDQLEQVVRELDIQALPLAFGRCLDCNEVLQKTARAEIEDQVPAYVLKTEQEFYVCPACRKVYWRGTHWRQMRKSLERLWGESGKPGGKK